jgi:hypothetical protein
MPVWGKAGIGVQLEKLDPLVTNTDNQLNFFELFSRSEKNINFLDEFVP